VATARALIGVTAVLSQACLGVEYLVAGAVGAGVHHIQNTERQPTITFRNDLSEPVCAVNLWRPSQPETEAEADWLELTDLARLEPGQRVNVGFLPRDGAYFLRAVGCGDRAFALSFVTLATITPGSTLSLGAAPPPPPSAPLPANLGL
jgi:hypothetical protein